MIYQYDQALQLPTVQLYDTQLMAMALNAAKDMYDKGEQQIKDFQKTYGDFMTPISADQDWYNKNVTGKVRDVINNIYARGGDPLRNAQDRAQLSMLINNMPYGDMARVRTSAENANEYLKARAKLEAEGLYNPMLAKYDGPSLSTYSTIDSGNVWDKMSPTPFQNVATFSNPYFEGMKPNVHKESKNGIEYAVEQITDDDLRAIADAHYNELVNTPQGQLMFNYYKDLAGGDAGKARQMFNNAIADSQHRRTYKVDNYEDNWFKKQQLENARAQLRLAAEKNQIARERNNMLANKGRSGSGSGSGGSKDKSLISYYEPLYQNLVINTLNKDPMRSTIFANNEFSTDMGASILSSQRNIADQYFAIDGVSSLYGGGAPIQKRFGIDYTKGDISGTSLIIGNSGLGKTVNPNISQRYVLQDKFNKNYKSYLKEFTGKNNGGFSSVFANSWKQGSAKVDNLTYNEKDVDKIKGQNYVAFGEEDIESVYSAKELSARMSGMPKYIIYQAEQETKRLRDQLRKKLNGGSVVMKATSPIGAGLSDIGQYGIFANTKFKTYDGNELTQFGDCVVMTPFMSTPNPNAANDDMLNLTFDQDTELERQIMDNQAVRGFGVSSNTGSMDNTLPDPSVWYDFGSYDDIYDYDY